MKISASVLNISVGAYDAHADIYSLCVSSPLFTSAITVAGSASSKASRDDDEGGL